MKFQLDFRFDSIDSISIKEKLMLCGSCFAEEMGEKFRLHKFNVHINPFGILFNPLSIFKALRFIAEKKTFTQQELVQENGFFHSLYHHGNFSSVSADECLQNINQAISTAHDFLKTADRLILTFGSAYAWRYKDTNEVVANCHKIPSHRFGKVLIRAEDIQQEWKLLQTLLHSFNPQLKFMFTVSPVRYVRDGLIENNRSKAQLISAVHDICEGSENHVYCPAYEWVNDVLRDYRFFKEDLVHPNSMAGNFVWEQFCDSLLDKDSAEILEQVKALNRLEQHRPLHAHTQAQHQEQVAKLSAELKSRYPFLVI